MKLPDNSAQIEKINSLIIGILGLIETPEAIVRTKELGEQLAFSDAKPILGKMSHLLTPMKGEDFSEISHKFLTELEHALHNVFNSFEEIRIFSARSNSSDPGNIRDALLRDLQNRYVILAEAIIPIAGFLSFYSPNISTDKEWLIESRKEVDALKTFVRSQSEGMISEVNNTLDSVRQASAKIGVAKFSTIFQEESLHHKKVASNWFWGMLGVMTALVAAGFFFLFYSSWFVHGDSPSVLIQLTVTKLLILTVLFYALNLCSKNYRSHTHNSILNKHRQNALNTFEVFVNSAGDDNQTKNAVLLETTRTIFSNQQTGYLSGENEVEVPSRIIEIIKSNKE